MSRAAAELERFLGDEAELDRRLERACLAQPPACASCGGRRVYRLAEGRYGCGRCERSFDLFAGRWLGRHRLSARQWLTALKGFELALDARTVGRWAGLSAATALLVLHTVRSAVVTREPSWAEIARACLQDGEREGYEVRRRGPLLVVEPSRARGGEPLDRRTAALLRAHLAARRGVSERFQIGS